MVTDFTAWSKTQAGADQITAGTLQLQPGFPMKVSIQCHLSDTRIIFQQGLRKIIVQYVFKYTFEHLNTFEHTNFCAFFISLTQVARK
jgi:hypothetical protein